MSALKKLATRVALLVGAIALVFGLTGAPAAQAVTVCLTAHVEANGQTLIDLPETCNTAP